MSSSTTESTAAVTPPKGWTNNEVRLHRAYYWADKPDTVNDKLQKRYKISKIAPLWVPDPDEGEVLFIFQANDSKHQLRYYLWNGLEDETAQFVETSLQKLKDEIDAGKGTLKNVKVTNLDPAVGA